MASEEQTMSWHFSGLRFKWLGQPIVLKVTCNELRKRLGTDDNGVAMGWHTSIGMFYERIEMTCWKNAWLIEWKVKDLEVSQKKLCKKDAKDHRKWRKLRCCIITTMIECEFFLVQAHLDNTHIHTRLTALCPGLPGWAGTRKVKSIWILLKQETVSGSGINWAICKSALCSRQTAMPAPHHLVFYRPDALPAAQPTASKHWRHLDKWLWNGLLL